MDHWQGSSPVDITAGDFTFFTAHLRLQWHLYRGTITPKDGRARKGNDNISAEPEMMR